MGRRKIHTEATSAQLLNAAEALLEQKGPDAVTVRAVALQARVSTRAVYALFGEKDGLLAGLSARGYEYLGKSLDAVKRSGDPHKDLVNAAVIGFRGFALGHPHLFRLTFVSVHPTAMQYETTAMAARGAYMVLRGYITAGQDAGIGTKISRSEFSVAYHALCQGLSEIELSHQPPPVGGNFWPQITGKDHAKMWTNAMTAYLDGLDDR